MAYETKNRKGEKVHIIGESKLMEDIYDTIDKVKDTQTPVFLIGETGTGKELISYALHFSSIRKDRPFNSIVFGSYNLDTIASQLFGHESGAYTDAKTRTNGLFSTTKDGTLFLDEVDVLQEDTQIALLKPIGDRYFYRVGGTKHIYTNARIIASAKHRKGIRPDLYNRLNVIRIDLPPLRERGEDISLLIEHFFGMYSEEHGKDGRDIKKLMGYYNRELKLYNWPGNVRELENLVERYVLLNQLKIDNGTAQSEMPPPLDPYEWTKYYISAKGRPPTNSELKQWVNEAIKAIVIQSGGNVSKAARALGIDGNYVRKILKKINNPLKQ